ncbi:MAG: protocatechuate 3,4-dioxygenase subunit alpha [Geodermatophilaceae bacterium]|nr:protocatechuate 3,4-dioxygenase subunit alpha [Geodermatophilaceae bacterium]
MTSDRLLSSPSQTVGPFLSIGMTWSDGEQVVPEGSPDACWIHGRLLDGVGEPVPDGVVETWQADQNGEFAHAQSRLGSGSGSFGGFGRSLSGPDGQYGVRTVKPGSVSDGAGGLQAPHLDVSVFARGLLHRVVMRIYFGDEEQANATDPVLSALPDDAARSTLIAAVDGDGGYALDIRLQGAHETVFFTV